jgi:hypothetical protein
VRFYRNGQEVYLRLDADLPTYSGSSLAYARTGPNNALWAPLMEKAYAFFRYGQNSYASLNGGWMSTVYQDLTNHGSLTAWTGATDQAYFNFLQTELNLGHAVTMASNSASAGPIIGGHAYMVKSATNSGGVMTVTVYNPWGIDGTSSDSNPYDGLVTLTITQLQQYFMGAVSAQI